MFAVASFVHKQLEKTLYFWPNRIVMWHLTVQPAVSLLSPSSPKIQIKTSKRNIIQSMFAEMLILLPMLLRVMAGTSDKRLFVTHRMVPAVFQVGRRMDRRTLLAVSTIWNNMTDNASSRGLFCLTICLEYHQ